VELSKKVAGSVLVIVACLLLISCGSDNSSGPDQGPVPTLAAFTPSVGTVGTEFTVTGTNFRSGAQAWFNEIPADSVRVISGAELRGFVPAGVDTNTVYSVTVRNSDLTAVGIDSAFTPVAPILRYVNSATKPSGIIGSTVIIEGDAFGDIQGTGEVLFSDGAGGTIPASIVKEDDWTNTFIVTTVPSGVATGDVTVETATGNSQALVFSIAQNATFSPSEISWTETTPLPYAASGLSASFIPVDEGTTSLKVVCVTGGIDEQDSLHNDVVTATVLPDGQLTSWIPCSSLPQPRAFHAAVVATPYNSRVHGSGYIYVLGGVGENGTDPVSTVYQAQLAEDGSPVSWMPARSLPLPMHSLMAVVFRSSIYVVGGSGTGDHPVSSVYRASIDSLGVLDEWQSMTSLPSAVSYHGLTSFGGYLHVYGGDLGTIDPYDANYNDNEFKTDQIYFMKIDLRTGDLATSAWNTSSSALVKPVCKHTVVAAGGYAFASGGLYNGAGNGSSENKYAQINSDGTLSSFHGATGSNTISSLGGGNLFNHAAISYVDAGGVAHVMILGGDDVNTPGARHSGVWFY
jgi:hypothetical protein